MREQQGSVSAFIGAQERLRLHLIQFDNHAANDIINKVNINKALARYYKLRQKSISPLDIKQSFIGLEFIKTIPDELRGVNANLFFAISEYLLETHSNVVDAEGTVDEVILGTALANVQQIREQVDREKLARHEVATRIALIRDEITAREVMTNTHAASIASTAAPTRAEGSAPPQAPSILSDPSAVPAPRDEVSAPPVPAPSATAVTLPPRDPTVLLKAKHFAKGGKGEKSAEGGASEERGSRSASWVERVEVGTSEIVKHKLRLALTLTESSRDSGQAYEAFSVDEEFYLKRSIRDKEKEGNEYKGRKNKTSSSLTIIQQLAASEILWETIDRTTGLVVPALKVISLHHKLNPDAVATGGTTRGGGITVQTIEDLDHSFTREGRMVSTQIATPDIDRFFSEGGRRLVEAGRVPTRSIEPFLKRNIAAILLTEFSDLFGEEGGNFKFLLDTATHISIDAERSGTIAAPPPGSMVSVPPVSIDAPTTGTVVLFDFDKAGKRYRGDDREEAFLKRMDEILDQFKKRGIVITAADFVASLSRLDLAKIHRGLDDAYAPTGYSIADLIALQPEHVDHLYQANIAHLEAGWGRFEHEILPRECAREKLCYAQDYATLIALRDRLQILYPDQHQSAEVWRLPLSLVATTPGNAFGGTQEMNEDIVKSRSESCRTGGESRADQKNWDRFVETLSTVKRSDETIPTMEIRNLSGQQARHQQLEDKIISWSRHQVYKAAEEIRGKVEVPHRDMPREVMGSSRPLSSISSSSVDRVRTGPDGDTTSTSEYSAAEAPSAVPAPAGKNVTRLRAERASLPPTAERGGASSASSSTSTNR